MIHLHCHSHYSLLCGASSPEDLARRAAALDLPALALTDLNALHGTVDFQQACAAVGIRAIHGVEITADRPRGTRCARGAAGPAAGADANDGARDDSGGACPGDGGGRDASGGTDDEDAAAAPPRLVPGALTPGRPRAVLLAADEDGYAAICRFTTLRQTRPDFDLLRELPALLAAETARGRCGNGRGAPPSFFCLTDSEAVLAALAAAPGGLAAAGRALRVLLTTAGGEAGPVYRRLRRLADWAAAHGTPAVAGGDVYAAAPAGLALQRLLATIRTGRTLATVDPAACAPHGAYLRPAREVAQLLDEFPGACAESEAIAAACRFQHRLGTWRYPEFPLPPGETAPSYLWKLCCDGLVRRYGRVDSAAMNRLLDEMRVVEKLAFAGYFLIVWDIVRYAAERGLPSVGRGSAANSLIAYALGITHVDPLAHDLYFQRFLNPERVSPPDIDLDFGWKDRDAVLAYIYGRYGRGCTAMICNLNRFNARAAYREVARAHGYGDREIAAFTRRLPRHALEDPAAALARVPEASALPYAREPHRSLLAGARDLDGFPRHLGIHAGGLVIGREPLTRLFPLQWARKGILVSQLDMYAIEALGLVKIDILAQRGLSVIADAARAAAAHGGPAFDLGRLPDDDPGARRLLREGETLGCFYVESPGMRALLRKLRADTFAAVVAASSVIRPGPADSGMARSFVLRHLGQEEATLPHPDLGFLRETYGVMIYQEDVMRTLSTVAGFSLAEADLMRRAMSFKGDPADFLSLKERFFAGARRTGAAAAVGEAGVAEIWRQVSTFAGYAFCKAHSASYAVLSFQAAYLKAHHPAEFMAAVLSNGGGYYSASVYLEEARRLGLRILLPDVNRSEAEYTGRDGALRIGLQQVHGLSRRGLSSLLAERRRDGFFVSLEDLLARVPALSRTEADNLIRCGACDGFAQSRPTLLWKHALLRKQGRSVGGTRRPAAAREGAAAALALFPAPGPGGATALVPAIPDFTAAEKLRQEAALLRLTASEHPLASLRSFLSRRGAVPAAALPELAGRRVRVAGLLVAAKTASVRKTGAAMKFLSLEDETALFEVTLFPRVYSRYGPLLLTRGPYLVTGRVEDDHGAVAVTAERLEVV